MHVLRGQGQALDPLELGLQGRCEPLDVGARTKLESPKRATSAFNC